MLAAAKAPRLHTPARRTVTSKSATRRTICAALATVTASAAVVLSDGAPSVPTKRNVAVAPTAALCARSSNVWRCALAKKRRSFIVGNRS